MRNRKTNIRRPDGRIKYQEVQPIPRCPKSESGQHYWTAYVEYFPYYHRGEECRDCGYRPKRRFI